MRGELVISSLLSMTGIAFVLLGILMWRKDKIELLHYYHYKNVSKEERQHYVKIVGKIYIFSGGLFIFSAIAFLFLKYGWIISVIGFIMFLIRMSHIQNRFNKPKRNKP